MRRLRRRILLGRRSGDNRKLIVLDYGRVWSFPDPVVIYRNISVLIDIY